MKLYALLFCIIFALNEALYAMEKKEEQIRELAEVLTNVNFPRPPLRSLINLCIPSLAVAIADKIKRDASYNFENFNKLLDLLTEKIDIPKFLILLHEELDEFNFERQSDFLNLRGINQVHFAGKKFVWDNFSNTGNCMVRLGNIEGKNYNVEVEVPSEFRQLLFTSSPDFFCYPLEQEVWIYALKSYDGLRYRDFRRIALPNNNSPFTTIALDSCSERCAVGNAKGEIFIISLPKLFDANWSKNADYCYKTKTAHQSSISSLYFACNSYLFSGDDKGTIVVWGEHDKKSLLPFRKKVSTIVSSADGSIIAFQDKLYNAALVLDLNSFKVYESTSDKIIAITESHKILATNNEHLCTYKLDGTLLKKGPLPQTARLFGNEMPLTSLPLYLMTTYGKVTKKRHFLESNSYDELLFPMTGIAMVEEIQTTFWLPKQFSPEELFKKLKK